jgi:hypothetical protein
MNQPRRYQFTVRRLLILSTAISIAFAFAGGFRGPILFRMIIGVYLGSIVAWFVMRWPDVRDRWRDSKRLRLAAIQRKRELAIEVAKQKPRVTRKKSDSTA